jgi:(4S)-4-hydroxy-5-phosphonooxypentane-2,3-dione isomerase
MLALIVEFQIHTQHIDAFAQAVNENARISRESEPGCRQFDVCRDPDNPSQFFLYELYDDAQAIEAHLRSDHFKHMNHVTAAWVVDKRVRTLRRTAP